MEEHRGNQFSSSEMEHSSSNPMSPERETQRDDVLQTHRSPLRLLINTIVAIFAAEVVAMIVVYFMEPLPYYQTTLIDAAIMTVLIFPALYLFSFRPLIRQMQKSWQAEESLLQARQLQERFFDSIDTLIAYMDRDFNFIRVNDGYARAGGYPKEYFAGKNHFDLYPHAENQEIFRRVVETGEGYTVQEKPFEYPDQRERGITYWNWSLQPVKNSDGRVEGVVLSLVDVTERKRAQEQLRSAYDDLELRVRDRTEKLRIANSELEDEINIRKRTEEALRQSELGLKQAQEIAHLGSWELDLTNNQLSWSDEVYRIFGLQPQEFSASYEAFLEVVHPDDRTAVDKAYSDSVREGKDGYEIEHRLIRRSTGEIRVVHEKCEHFRNEAGQIIRSVGMVHDITDRKKAEEALRRNQALLNQTGEMAKVGGWEFDPQTSTLVWSLETYRIHEVDPSVEPTVDTAIDFYAPEARPAITEALARAIEEGQPYDLELRFITANGKELWIRTKGQPEFSGGKCVRVFGTFQDITQRKHAQEELRLARDELELRVQERTQELAVANQELLSEIAEREEIERTLRVQTTAIEAAASGIVITDRQGNIQWINPALLQISGYAASDLIGKNMRIFKSGQHSVTYYSQLWETILAGKVWRGETTNRRKDASFYVEEQTITPVRDNHGEVIQFIAVKQDITERKKAEKDIWERDQKEKILTQTIHTMQLDIARDLHDTIGQNISFLRMKLDYLAEEKIRRKSEMQLELQSMARAANESYDLMRGTLAVLQSTDSSDLFRLFTRYAEQIEERASFKTDLSSRGEPRFMSAKRMRHLFYVFREILNNIEKHAKASQVTIEMVWEQDCLMLIVHDNGSGFDVDKVQYGSHYGLKFMKERVELLNGSLSIRSAAGSGTSITLQVPYQ